MLGRLEPRTRDGEKRPVGTETRASSKFDIISNNVCLLEYSGLKLAEFLLGILFVACSSLLFFFLFLTRWLSVKDSFLRGRNNQEKQACR